MRFSQLDRITELVCGERIAAVKGLTMAETYLDDHFPRFPVMPGVLMLESMYQASQWLLLASTDFRYSAAFIREAKQVRFQDFVEPGHQLTVTSKIHSWDDSMVTIRAQGTIDDRPAVKANLKLECVSLVEKQLVAPSIDWHLRTEYFRKFNLLLDQRNPLYDSTRFSLNESPQPAAGD